MSGDLIKVVLVGMGQMAVDYANVLKAQKISFTVVGRSESKVESFKAATGIEAASGGIENFTKNGEHYTHAIVAVDLQQLYPVTLHLIQSGVKNILLEKPGSMTLKEVTTLLEEAKKNNTEIYIAYNRRFYSSVKKAREIIEKDGGVQSFLFEFTEWSHQIAKLDKPKEVKENWFMANSSHVLDLAFHLGGEPVEMTSFQSGTLEWHSKASVFAGAGKSKSGALFSYQANWAAPGRWGVEILTAHSRLILRPMEQLQLQKIGSVAVEPVVVENELDQKFKPGLYEQVSAFIGGEQKEYLLPIEKHYNLWATVYNKILK